MMNSGLYICIDYRMLNNNNICDSYHLPYIGEMLIMFKGAWYFSYLYLIDGYL